MQMFRQVMALLILVGMTGTATAQVTTETAAAAKELTTLLEGHAEGVAPRFMATYDPTEDDRYVAAMLLPGIQLVIVSAEYPVRVLFREHMLRGRYQEAYQDLSSASVVDTRLTIEDIRADGLAPRPGKGQTAADVVIRGEEDAFRFDGQWRRNRMREAEYMEKFKETEAEYLRLMGLLIAQAKQPQP
jgi:hypothetical protein